MTGLAVLDAHRVAEFVELQDVRSLVLIGNVGPTMWEKIPPVYFDHEHPVDDYVRDVVYDCMSKYADPATWRLLFPGTDTNCPPLQSLGKAAGWHYDSPLGLGVNPRWGLWFAYRAVIALSIDLNPLIMLRTESPCVDCETKACVSQCPGKALTVGRLPDLGLCSEYRLRSESACAETCVARLACPVAADLRYDETQIEYHYRLALSALSRWSQR